MELRPNVKHAGGVAAGPASGSGGGGGGNDDERQPSKSKVPDGYGVYETWGKNGAPPPSMMQHRTGKAQRSVFTGEKPDGVYEKPVSKPEPEPASAPAKSTAPSRTPKSRGPLPDDPVTVNDLPDEEDLDDQNYATALPSHRNASGKGYSSLSGERKLSASNSESSVYNRAQHRPSDVDLDMYDNCDAAAAYIPGVQSCTPDTEESNTSQRPATVVYDESPSKVNDQQTVLPGYAQVKKDQPSQQGNPASSGAVYTSINDTSAHDNIISEPEYATVDETMGSPKSSSNPPPVPLRVSSAASLLQRLNLFDKCGSLAEEAGIDEDADFLLFSESELVSQHGFKAGHARKILAAVKKA